MKISKIAVLLAFLCSQYGQAGEIFCDEGLVRNNLHKFSEENKMRLGLDQCLRAEFAGEIRKGDLEKFERMITAQPIQYLNLNSVGGDLDEAIRIGRLVRHHNLHTFVYGEDHFCSSACFFIWAGGIYRSGDPSIHRPYLPDGELGKLSIAEANKLYVDLTRKITAYLSEIHIELHLPADFVSVMMSTPPSDAFYLSDFVHESPGLTGKYEPGIEQFLLDKCGSLKNTSCMQNEFVNQMFDTKK